MFVDRERKRYEKCLNKGTDKEVSTLLGLAYKLLPHLDYSGNDRPHYDVYRSAISKLTNSIGNSITLNLLANVLNLGELSGLICKFTSDLDLYSQSVYDYQHFARKWDHYTESVHLEGKASTLYASIKSWPKDEDLVRFESTILTNYVRRRTNIWLLSPIEVFLSLSEDSLEIIVKGLVFNKFTDKGSYGDLKRTLMKYQDLILSARNSGILSRIKKSVIAADDLYLSNFGYYERDIRSLLPDRESRDNYIAWAKSQ